MLNRRTVLSGVMATAAWPAAAMEGDLVRAAVEGARARADRLLRDQGLSDGSVADRLARLARDERWLYPDDDAGRDSAVADMNARLTAIRPRLPQAFRGLPLLQVQVRRMPPAEAAAGKAGYRTAEAYFVDLKAIRSRPMWSLPSVAFHEVLPGHLLQLNAPSTGSQAPFFEGWAIYAERLAADLGAYAGDPLGEIGFLHWRLFRLARAVADAGLNGMGWSRQQALAEMQAIQGPAIAFVTLEADVERIAARPGQVAAEALAMLHLERARPRRRGAWPAWHQRVLKEGARCCSIG